MCPGKVLRCNRGTLHVGYLTCVVYTYTPVTIYPIISQCTGGVLTFMYYVHYMAICTFPRVYPTVCRYLPVNDKVITVLHYPSHAQLRAPQLTIIIFPFLKFGVIRVSTRRIRKGIVPMHIKVIPERMHNRGP